MRRLAALPLLLLALAAPATAQSPAPRPPAPSLANSGLSNSGLANPPLKPLGANGGPLISLAPVADPAAQCRVQCAKGLNLCSDGSDDACVNTWRQCVTGCRTAR